MHSEWVTTSHSTADVDVVPPVVAEDFGCPDFQYPWNETEAVMMGLSWAISKADRPYCVSTPWYDQQSKRSTPILDMSDDYSQDCPKTRRHVHLHFSTLCILCCPIA